jgi:hypothetical protein
LLLTIAAKTVATDALTEDVTSGFRTLCTLLDELGAANATEEQLVAVHKMKVVLTLLNSQTAAVHTLMASLIVELKTCQALNEQLSNSASALPIDSLEPARASAQGATETAIAGDSSRHLLQAAAANLTYTLEDGKLGLVAWLNDKTSYSSGIVHVALPSGNVWRGNAELNLTSGLVLEIEGQGREGASATTLNLDKQNLNLGIMLGGSGRLELRNMRITNGSATDGGVLRMEKGVVILDGVVVYPIP